MNLRFLVFFLLFALSGLCSKVAAAPLVLQEPTSIAANQSIVRLTTSQVSHFADALNAIAQQAHTAIVCEGQPLYINLSEKEVSKLPLDDMKQGMPCDAVIRVVAQAFDYKPVLVSVGRKGTYYQFTKRFSDKEELPFVTFAETTNALEQIVSATKRFTVPAQGMFAAESLYLSLTDEQHSQVQKGILFNNLSPKQQDFTFAMTCGFSLGELDLVKAISQRLRICQDPKTHLLRTSRYALNYGVSVPSYAGDFGYQLSHQEVLLVSWYAHIVYGPYGLTAPPDVPLQPREGKSPLVLHPEKEPTLPRNPKEIPPAEPLLTHTLKEIGDTAVKEAKGNEGQYQNIFVDPALAEKPVYVAGGAYLNPVAVLQAGARVYELEVRFNQTEKSAAIRLPTAAPLTFAADIPLTVQRLIPVSVRRCMENRKNQPDRMTYLATLQRIREIIEPEMDRRKALEIPLPEAGDAARNLIALSILLDDYRHLEALQKPAPVIVDNLDSSKLEIHSIPAKQQAFFFGVSTVNEKGLRSGTQASITFGSGNLPPL